MKFLRSILVVINLISASITLPALILMFIDKNIGLIEVDPNLLNKETFNKIQYFKEFFFSFQKSKDLGNGFVAYSAIDTSQGIVANTLDIEPNLKILSCICGLKYTGLEQRNPLLFENISYSIYGKMDDNLDETGIFYVDIFDLKSGEIKRETPIVKIPKILQNLNDKQIYGLDPLPKGVIRIDSNWIENANYPTIVIRISENCNRLVLLIFSLHLLFGSLLLFSSILIKIYS